MHTKKIRKQIGMHYKNWWSSLLSMALSGQAIRTPTFRRFARIDSQKDTYFWSTWPDSREFVFSLIRIEIAWFATSPRCYPTYSKVDSQINFFLKRESIRTNRPTKLWHPSPFFGGTLKDTKTNGHQNANFHIRELAILKPSVLIPLWLLKSHPNGYQNEWVQECQVKKSCHFENHPFGYPSFGFCWPQITSLRNSWS